MTIIDYEEEATYISDRAGVSVEEAWRFITAEECFFIRSGINKFGDNVDADYYKAKIESTNNFPSDDGIDEELCCYVEPRQQAAYISRKTGFPLYKVCIMQEAEIFFMIKIGIMGMSEEDAERILLGEDFFYKVFATDDKGFVWSGPVPKFRKPQPYQNPDLPNIPS